MARKKRIIKTFSSSGDPVTITVLDGLFVEDLVIQGMQAEAYRVITGNARDLVVGRDLKDYLIKLGIVTE